MEGGISFGGVLAFIFADLLALPLVLIYRKFYGTRLAVRLALVFWAVMSVAGLITEGIFWLLSLTPSRQASEIAATHVGLNYTTVLNLIAVAAFGYLYWLYRNRERFGGGEGLAKDVVCGMQVRTSDAPAQASHDATTASSPTRTGSCPARMAPMRARRRSAHRWSEAAQMRIWKRTRSAG